MSNKGSNRIFLLDAYALIYRAYYAFIRNPRINSKGLNTSAAFGFTNALLDILLNEDPSHVAIAFDPPSPTFRSEIYPEYKANRQEMPEDIRKAIPYIKRIIDAFYIPVLEEPEYEADDVIGTLAHGFSTKGNEVYIVTPDKDFGQLIEDRIFMYKPGKGGSKAELIGKKEICNKYGIDHPKQLIDIMALWGDSVDNIPGAPGIGEKTAIALIKKYDNLENLYKHIDDLKGKQKENLVNFKEQVMLSKDLVTIRLDSPLEVRIEELEINEPDNNLLKSILEELEFRSIINRLSQEDTDSGKEKEGTDQGLLFSFGEGNMSQAESSYNTIENTNHEYRLIESKEERKKLIEILKKKREFCFDTETTGISMNSEIVGMAISFKAHEAYYIPFPGDFNTSKSILSEFKEIFENKEFIVIGQNIKFDMQVLQRYGIELNGILFDTMLAHYLIQPDLRHNLDFLCETYLNYSPVSIESLIGKKGKNQMSMRSVPLKDIVEYAGEDADVTFQLKYILEKKLKENQLENLFNKTESPLIRVLSDMEMAGFKLDHAFLKSYAVELKNELEQIEKDIFKLSGYEFNISSPKQLGEILFDRLKIDEKAKKTSKSKQYSTSEETLIRLKDKHEIIPKILEQRSVKKLLSTYVEALPELVNQTTGKIHTSFNQTVAATGRLSSTSPNLQNIPIREERGREIRKAFIPSQGNSLLAADYSQIELRIMAHFSKDKYLIEAFKNNEDIHASTASKIFNVKLDEVTRDMRSGAKTANFGIIYGISAFGLSQRLNIKRSEAKDLIDSYFDAFPGVKKYMEESVVKAREYGYVQTILGRKRMLPDINSRNATVRGFAERNAINAPIQGSAADIIKIAMINIHKEFLDKKYQTKMILQVHDELIFDTPAKEIEEIKIIVKEKMEKAIFLDVPLVVDVGIGKNWMEAH
ncbi:DNA polymerase I [Bacteroidota bacterium]